MRTFECPKCHARQKALAVEVGHNCPSNRSKWVKWEDVSEREER